MIDRATLEVMIEQMLEGDYSVYDTAKSIIEADLSEKDTKLVMDLFTKAYNGIELQNISDIQMSLALYTIGAEEDMKKFYKWVSDRLEKVLTKEWTLKQFFDKWDNAYTGIHDKMGNEDTGVFNRAAMANIVGFINDIKVEI